MIKILKHFKQFALIGTALMLASCGKAPQSVSTSQQQALSQAGSYLSAAGDTSGLADSAGKVAAMSSDAQNDDSGDSGNGPEFTPVYICILNPQDDSSATVDLKLIAESSDGVDIAIDVTADRGDNGPENPQPSLHGLVLKESVTLPDDAQTKATVFHSPDFFQLISSDSPEDADFVHPGFFNSDPTNPDSQPDPTICIDLSAVPSD